MPGYLKGAEKWCANKEGEATEDDFATEMNYQKEIWTTLPLRVFDPWFCFWSFLSFADFK